MGENGTTNQNSKEGAESGFLARLLSDCADAWYWPNWAIIVLWIIPFFVAGLGPLTALMGKPAYKLLTGEDAIAETAQALFYFLAFILSLILMYQRWRGGDRLIGMLFGVLALGLFFLIGEELSWGQRIFDWNTFSSLAEVNKQGETNLHNIYGVGATFKWIQALVAAYGGILPLIVLTIKVPDRYREFTASLIPHYSLVPYFIFLFLWRLYRNLLEAPEEFYFVISEYNEVLELNLAIGFFLFTVFQLRRMKFRSQNIAEPMSAADEIT